MRTSHTGRLARLATALAAAGLLLAGCGQSGSAEPSGPVTADTAAPATDTPPPVLETVATGLTAPWGLDFFANGDAILTERDTRRVLRVSGPDHTLTELGFVDEAIPNGEGGLLGVALSPDFAKDRQVFFYLSTPDDNRIVRTTLRGNRFGSLTPILTGIPTASIHDGGRLVFGPDGYLYASTGEGGVPDRAQDKDSLGGKILRITTDGEPAPGNPFDTPVWSYGHRNVQGLAFVGKQLWASEFGLHTFDELNRIEKGQDYGWPEVEGAGGTDQGFVDPQVVWGTDTASPSGLAYAGGHLWMAALAGERLWRIDVTQGTDGTATAPQPFFIGEYGRMRTVATAPDGTLWLTTSNLDGRGDPRDGDDRVLVLDPS